MHIDSNKQSSAVQPIPRRQAKGRQERQQTSSALASLRWAVGPFSTVLFLLVVAYLLSAAFHSPPPWTLQIGGQGDGRFSTGFFLAEESDGLPFRWSGPEARLVLHGADAAPLALEMRVNGDQILRSGDPRLSIVAEQPTTSGPVSTTLQVAAGWHRYYLLLPPSAPGSQPPAYDLLSGTSRPGPQDGRDLGAAVSTVRLLPIENTSGSWLLRGWPLHPRALYFAWMLALLFWTISAVLELSSKFLVRRNVGASTARLHLDHRGLMIARSLAGALVATLAIGLIVWARTSPYTLASLLPPLPWTSVILTVALLAGPVVNGLTMLGQRARLSSRTLLWSGITLLVVAQCLLNAQILVPLGIILALFALAVIIVAERVAESQSVRDYAEARSDARLWAKPAVLLAGIFALALFLRFYELASLPYGLWRDEARHGLVALRILDDPEYRPIYVAEGGVNMPALTFYPFALTIKLWGIHPWTMRPLTALAGALTVLPLYALARRLFGVRPALIAALLYAVSAWHLTVSRFSFPTVFDPLFGLTGLWLLVVAWDFVRQETGDRRYEIAEKASRVSRFTFHISRLGSWLGSGIFMGLAIQTYHTGRVVPVIGGLLALGLLWETIQNSITHHPSPITHHLSPVRHYITRWLAGLLTLAVGFLLVAGPMIWYALRQEAQFNDRVSGVFLLSEDALKGRAPLAALDETLGKHLLLFNVRGDENGRHAPPNRPGLDFISGLGMLAGAALLLRRRPDGAWPGFGWRGLFLFAAIGLSLLPSALAVDAPHGMRGVGAIAFACIVAALGLEWLRHLLKDERRETKDERKAVIEGRRRSSFVLRPSSFAPMIVLLLAFSLNFYTYFIWMKADPAVWVSFYPVHTQAGAYVRELREQDPNRQIFVAAGVATNPVFVYLTYGYNVQTFDAGVASEPLRPGAIFILSGYTYTKDKVTLAPYLGPDPQPLATGPDFPDGRSPSFVAYPATQPAAEAQR